MVKFNPTTGLIELEPLGALGIGVVIFLLGAFSPILAKQKPKV